MRYKVNGMLQQALQFAAQGMDANKDHLYDEFKEGMFCAYEYMFEYIEILIKDCEE